MGPEALKKTIILPEAEITEKKVGDEGLEQKQDLCISEDFYC